MSLCYRYPNAQKCVNCGWNMFWSVGNRKSKADCFSQFEYRVGDLPAAERELLASWVPLTEELERRPVCCECVDILSRLADSPRPVERQLGHAAVCASCGMSVLRKRTHPVNLSRPEFNVILRQYLQLSEDQDKAMRVCQPCSLAARGEIERQQRKQSHVTDIPISSDHKLVMETNEPECAEESPATLTLRSGATVTTSVTTMTATSKPSAEMVLPGYWKVRGKKGSTCVACEQPAVRRLNLPTRQQLLLRRKIYVSTSARVCEEHRQATNWTNNEQPAQFVFTSEEIADMTFLMKLILPVDFGNIENLHPFVLKKWLGMSHEEFQENVRRNAVLTVRDEGKFALAVFLASKHTGECGTVLASVCQRPRAAVAHALTLASEYIK